MKNKNEKTKFRLRDWVPIWAIVLFAVFAVAVIIEILSKSDKALADAINDGSGPVIRVALAKMTNFLPFSFAESLLLCSPALLVIFILLIVRAGNKSRRALVKFTSGALAVISLAYSVFVFGYGTGYYGRTIDEKLGLER